MDKKVLFSELEFKAVRSSGPGGQNVNKVATKIQLLFNVESSRGLSDKEKQRLLQKISGKLTKDKVLILHCDESRSQSRNKQLVTQRFFDVVKKALYIPKKRKPTKPSKSSVEKRLKSKKKLSDKKTNRKKPEF